MRTERGTARAIVGHLKRVEHRRGIFERLDSHTSLTLVTLLTVYEPLTTLNSAIAMSAFGHRRRVVGTGAAATPWLRTRPNKQTQYS